MPTYDYRCDACGHELEVFQSMTESPKRKCPACGERKLVRQIGTGGAILFKGSGFYLTDYRSESFKSAERNEREASEPKADSGKKEKKEKKDPGGGEAPAKAG